VYRLEMAGAMKKARYSLDWMANLSVGLLVFVVVYYDVAVPPAAAHPDPLPGSDSYSSFSVQVRTSRSHKRKWWTSRMLVSGRGNLSSCHVASCASKVRKARK
jgi:hypothetical protein